MSLAEADKNRLCSSFALYIAENLGYNTDPKICGSSSVVEHDLAKVGVAGSTPVSRSIFLKFFLL